MKNKGARRQGVQDAMGGGVCARCHGRRRCKAPQGEREEVQGAEGGRKAPRRGVQGAKGGGEGGKVLVRGRRVFKALRVKGSKAPREGGARRQEREGRGRGAKGAGDGGGEGERGQGRKGEGGS